MFICNGIHYARCIKCSIDQRTDNTEQKIAERSSCGHNNPHQPGPSEVVAVHRNRTGPAESGKEQQDNTEQIKVNGRVQRHAAKQSGCRIAELIGKVCMGELMHSKCDYNRNQKKRKLLQGIY
ncbi:hypothetical protein D3C74_373950 [compost metagenome]